MIRAKINTELWAPIILEDSAGADINSVAYNTPGLSVYYIKEGGDWVEKILASGDWDFCADVVANGARVFKIKFSADELDTLGNFNFSVYYTGALTYDGLIEVVNNKIDDVATAVGTRAPAGEYDTEMARLDVDVSSRATPADIPADIATETNATANKDELKADIEAIDNKNFTGIPL